MMQMYGMMPPFFMHPGAMPGMSPMGWPGAPPPPGGSQGKAAKGGDSSSSSSSSDSSDDKNKATGSQSAQPGMWPTPPAPPMQQTPRPAGSSQGTSESSIAAQ